MMTIEMFKEICGMKKITFFKGKGREFAPTPIGTVYVGSSVDWDLPVFVIQNDGSLPGKEYLKGTYWFVNAGAQETRTK
jgi:hypothetical protein